MNAKINVCSLIKGHIKTLYNASTHKLDCSDVVTFFIIPAVIAVLCSVFGIYLSNDIISLLVNFGSIFTALLLSVLVLVYDQVGKITEKLNTDKNNSMLELKFRLLQDLYFNISYSMILSLLLIVLCLIYSIGCSAEFTVPYLEIELSINRLLFLPLIIFVTINLILTILMIIKRLHSLLISKN